MEEEVLRKWKAQRAFETSLKRHTFRQAQGKKVRRFVFYEGPPTANGAPGIHHVLSRAFKDVVCRYKTMRGFLVERKAGWDTHGLPVELQIEKKLGLKSKKEIEQYGIAKFNKECRQSVWEFKKEWENLTERIGFWIDTKNPYITYEKEYMETLWWVIKQFWQKKLLYKDYKVVPYCPRCGTPLSSHELAQGYKTVKDRSVYVKFKIPFNKTQGRQNTYFLAWTTTPWTLPGNVALAVGKDIQYAFVRQGEETYILAKNLLSKLQGEYKIVKEVLGKELEGLEYEPLFDSLKKQPEKKHYVALGDFVSTEDGTGIVHTAVMYGEDDYKLGQKLGLPKKHTVDEEGKFNELVPKWKGMFVKSAEPLIVEDLKQRNLLYKEELYEHEYPFCWRCSTPLLYYAKDSWFVNMQKVKKELIRNNQTINWVPTHIKDGRMGEWLAEVKDWAFSRDRYWGTPLPVWECDSCEHREVMGSLDDLKKHTTSSNTYYLLRHGHSMRQVKNIASSYPEPESLPLTSKGVKQLAKVANGLSRKKIDLIFSSDLLRTKQTAEIIGKKLSVPIIYDPRLRELGTGIFNGKPIREFGAYFRKEGETTQEHYLRRFLEGPPQGENWFDVEKRLSDFLSAMEKKYDGKHILLISHELPLSLVEKVAGGMSREDFVQFREKKAVEPGEIRRVAFSRLPINEDLEVDLHRPHIDSVEFPCVSCAKGTMKRVREVADVWFDSGAMPFASAKPPRPYPADYIVEAIDQTRGWFYTLLAVATLLGLKAPYKNVISLGHLLDENGEKMSKSKGNVVNPWDMIGKYGVDTLRWYFYTLNHPWDSKLFVEKDLQQAMRKFILTLWNSFVFYNTYKPNTKYPSTALRAGKIHNILDRWIFSRLHSVIKEATKKFDEYDITGTARLIEGFVIDDLSLWYIRRSRARFQNSANKKELQDASSVLRYVLLEISKLTAPFIPFLSEHIYGELGGKGSVHWEDWPKADQRKINAKLEKEMAQVRELVAKGLAERAKAGIKVRQPLGLLKIPMSKPQFSKDILGLIKDELNVKEVIADPKIKEEVELDTTITPALQREGMLREILRHIQGMRKQAGYRPQDKVRLRYAGDEQLKEILKENEKTIMSAVGLKEMTEGDRPKQTFDIEEEFSLEGRTLHLAIRKL